MPRHVPSEDSEGEALAHRIAHLTRPIGTEGIATDDLLAELRELLAADATATNESVRWMRALVEALHKLNTPERERLYDSILLAAQMAHLQHESLVEDPSL